MGQDRKEMIQKGYTALGIELGSTRIKSVLIDSDCNVLGTGSYSWENRFENGLWTYRLEDAIDGLQKSFRSLTEDVTEKYGVELAEVGSIGISGMMHGYLALDKDGKQLAPFLTWRNTNTVAAAQELTERFAFNIPLRWSIAQLYQAILNQEDHVKEVDYLTTLAGYVHYMLSGERVMGIGEASGMFPIDPETLDYDEKMLEQFRELTAHCGYPWDIRGILPQVLTAGQCGGYLTEAGARLLDPTGTLKAGILMAPPEGDAGTGMVATDSVEVGTGNVSAGTSIFSMIVLEKPLSRLYKDIDIVMTPAGKPVAMIHCNNGTSELDAWIKMYAELLEAAGVKMSMSELYELLFRKSMQGDADCDHVLLYNFVSGEPVAGLIDGRPLLVRMQDSKLTLANFMRSQIYSVLASLTIGMKILADEQVHIKKLTGHGGLFKSAGAAQQYLAVAMNVPVTVMKTAGEGGPYGMAVLASYLKEQETMSLEAYLENRVFLDADGITVAPDQKEAEGYAKYLKAYEAGLPVVSCAVNCIK